MSTQLTQMGSYPQPEWNAQDSVSVALESVVKTHDKESSSYAYNQLLYAVGNNHAGTYYPVALAIMSDIESILIKEKPWPQRTALEVLVDLYSSFVPEPGYEIFDGVSLSATLQERILALKPHVEFLAKSPSIVGNSASELLDCFNETAA